MLPACLRASCLPVRISVRAIKQNHIRKYSHSCYLIRMPDSKNHNNKKIAAVIIKNHDRHGNNILCLRYE